jgi:hypothetical protein
MQGELKFYEPDYTAGVYRPKP